MGLHVLFDNVFFFHKFPRFLPYWNFTTWMICASAIQGVSQKNLDHFGWNSLLDSHLWMLGIVFLPYPSNWSYHGHSGLLMWMSLILHNLVPQKPKRQSSRIFPKTQRKWFSLSLSLEKKRHLHPTQKQESNSIPTCAGALISESDCSCLHDCTCRHGPLWYGPLSLHALLI